MRKIRISFSAIMMLMLVGLFGIIANAAAAPNAGIPIVTSSNSVLVGQDYTLTWTKSGSNNVDNYKIIWDGGSEISLDNTTLSYTFTGTDVALGTHKYEIWAAAATNGDSQHYRGTVEVVNDISGDMDRPNTALIGNDGNPATHRTHGNFQNNSASCANCHSAHNGGTDMLLKFKDTELSMCMSCHDGTMGFYNVEVASSAGIFDFDSSHKSSSLHNVDDGVNVDKAPGAFKNVRATDEFACSSCHNPHGSANDRLLTVEIPTADGLPTGTPIVTMADLGSGKQVGLNLVEDPAFTAFNATTGAGGIKITKANGASTANEVKNFNNFCATCHDSYLTSRSAGKTAGSYTDGHKYGHSTNSNSAGRNCASCHYSHGTDITTMKDSAGKTVADYVAGGWDQAKAEAYMENVTGTFNSTTDGYTNTKDSALKKYTNNAVCLACHAKDVVAGYTVGQPVPIPGQDFDGKPAK
jgi:predicted CXXCH cytochrome family protein